MFNLTSTGVRRFVDTIVRPEVLLSLVVAGYPVIGLLAATTPFESRVITLPFRVAVAGLAAVLFASAMRMRAPRLDALKLLFICFLGIYGFHLSLNWLNGYPSSAEQLVFYVMTVALPTVALLNDPAGQKEKVMSTLVITFCVAACVLVLVGEGTDLFGANTRTFSGRLSTTTLNPVTLGHTAGTLLLVLLAVHHFAFGRPLRGAGAVLIAAIGFVVISLSGSRGPFLAVAGTALFFALALPVRPLFSRRRVVAMATLVAAVVLYMFPIPNKWWAANSFSNYSAAIDKEIREGRLEYLVARVEANRLNRQGLDDHTIKFRIELLERSLSNFIERPFFGTSNHVANQGKYPHNLAVEAFLNLGIVGGLGFGVLIASGMVLSWRAIRAQRYAAAVLFIQALLAGMVSGSLYGGAQLFAALAVLIGSRAVQPAVKEI